MNHQTADLSDDSCKNVEDNLTIEPLSKRFKYNCPSLDTISNDFLLQIWQYLDILDSVNLASTCTRLLSFACDFIFPKQAREMVIQTKDAFIYGIDDLVFRSQLKMSDLEIPFKRFGSFVEHLALRRMGYRNTIPTYSARLFVDFEKLLDLCPNLHSLCLNNLEFRNEDVHLFRHVTAGLEELQLVYCSGITNKWSEELNRFTKLQISMISYNGEIVDIFKLNNLSSLTIDDNPSLSDLGTILNKNAQSLRQLNMKRISHDYREITSLIIEKLPNLESLAIELTAELTNSLPALPHLKSLKLSAYGYPMQRVNSLLRKLSDCGTIEDLCIESSFVFDVEDKNEPPLVFKKLQSFACSLSECEYGVAPLCKALTKSHMPEVRRFDFSMTKLIDDVWPVIESKKTLITLTIEVLSCYDAVKFLQGLFEILKQQKGSRPYLNLNMNGLSDEGVSNLSITSLFFACTSFFLLD